MPGNARPSGQAILILATTWWPAPARIATAFSRLGFEVAAICPAGHPLLKTRSVARRFHYPARNPIRALAHVISGLRPQMLVPCDDRAAAHLHALHARTRQTDEATAGLICASLGAPDPYRTLSSRHAVLRAAVEAGVRVPGTVLLRSPADSASLRMPFPWVVKASGTWGGAGVRVVHDPDEAHRAAAEMGRPLGAARALKRLLVNRDGFWLAPWFERTVPEVIAQAYVAGQPANIAAVCWQGELLATLSVRVLRTQGPTGPATLVRVIDHPEMTEAARRLARRFGLSGLHGLDFMLDSAGAAWLIELNPRATQLCHFALEGGTSLVETLAAQLTGVRARPAPPAMPGAMIAFFPQAWRSDPANPLLRTAAHDVPWDEPALVEDLMLPPWPNRGPLARAWQALAGQPAGSDAWAGAAPVPHTADHEPARQSDLLDGIERRGIERHHQA